MYSRLAMIVFLDGGGNYPDNSLPSVPGRPDQGLPGFPPRPDQGLPGWQPRPDQGLPGQGGRPDQGLPSHPPYPSQGLPPFATQLPVFPSDPSVPPQPGTPTHPIVLPGRKFEVKWSPVYGWILVPVEGEDVGIDNTLPEYAQPK